MCVRLIIHVGKTVYDDIIISYDSIKINTTSADEFLPIKLNKNGFNADLVSLYITTIKLSYIYRQSAIKLLEIYLKNCIFKNDFEPIIFLRLRMPRRQFLDYKWSERMNILAMERREIDYAMSWLSTLGGAFSAMGEQFHHHAKVAGDISIEQFKLALRLGDPLIVARCQLYASLSLIQQNKFQIPRKLIPKIFKYANKSDNKQLARMCQGIWAKLKYSISKNNQNKYLTC